jgi:hypothetical protein
LLLSLKIIDELGVFNTLKKGRSDEATPVWEDKMLSSNVGVYDFTAYLLRVGYGWFLLRPKVLQRKRVS